MKIGLQIPSFTWPGGPAGIGPTLAQIIRGSATDPAAGASASTPVAGTTDGVARAPAPITPERVAAMGAQVGRPGELVVAIHVPTAAHDARSAFLKLGARRYLVISIVMVAATLEIADGRIVSARIAVGACSAVAQRLPALEAAVAVYGVLDPDKAGLSAAERLAPIIGDRWRPVHLPDGLDLAELAARGPSSRGQFDALVGRARAAAWLNEETTSA